MAQIVTITNPLTGQPAQVDQLEHTAQQIDDGIGFESTDYPGCYYRMVSGVVEWFNPPMQLGVEYRTTERYLGKPVYAMAVDFGAMPNATTKSVTWQGSGVVSSVLSVEASDSNGGALGLGASLSGTEITATKTLLYVKSAGNYSSTSAVFRIKYTKTTD